MSSTDDAPAPFHPEAFEALREGEWRPSSEFLMVLPSWAPVPDAHGLMDAARAAGIELDQDDREEGDLPSNALFAVSGDNWQVIALEIGIGQGDLDHVAPDFRDEDGEAVLAAHHGLLVSTTIGEPVLERFHEALKAMAALAPEAVALHDQGAQVWRPRTWIEDAVRGLSPPSPLSLFSLHAVRGDDDRVWIHTHGLVRCGTIELEILDVAKEQSGPLSHLINTAALMLIERGAPDPEQPFEVGRDMRVAWRPWNEALEDAGPLSAGGMDDRPDHDFLVGSLYVPTDRKTGLLRRRPVRLSVAEYVPLIEGNPIFYISAMETRRMTMLALERFKAFRSLEKRFRDDGEWTFLVKLGYAVDEQYADDPAYPSNEHLWFEVHAVDQARVDATLINEPYAIARMGEGDRDWHAVDELSDWTIQSPLGSFGPDRVGLLQEHLDGQG